MREDPFCHELCSICPCATFRVTGGCDVLWESCGSRWHQVLVGEAAGGRESWFACGWRVPACATGATRALACVRRDAWEGRLVVPLCCWQEAEPRFPPPTPSESRLPSPPRWLFGGGGVAPFPEQASFWKAPACAHPPLACFRPLHSPLLTQAKTTLDKELQVRSVEFIFGF